VIVVEADVKDEVQQNPEFKKAFDQQIAKMYLSDNDSFETVVSQAPSSSPAEVPAEDEAQVVLHEEAVVA
jgi:hypothetical protein